MKSLIGARITGIIYQDKAGEKKLLSGLSIQVKFLSSSRIIGVLYHDDADVECIMNDIELEGLTYQTEASDDEKILEAVSIAAILYGDPATLGETSLSESRIMGLAYREEGSEDTKLLAEFSHTVEILLWPRVTGILCREEHSSRKKILKSSAVSGFLYQDEGLAEVKLVSGVNFSGILCEKV